MVLIKQYTMTGVAHTGEHYSLVQDFLPVQVGNRCHFDPRGIPRDVALDLVAGWNRTTDIYARQDPTYNQPIYGIVDVEMPVAPQCTSTVNTNIAGTTVESAFELVKHGQWSLTDFEEWCLTITAESAHEGYLDGVKEYSEDFEYLSAVRITTNNG